MHLFHKWTKWKIDPKPYFIGDNLSTKDDRGDPAECTRKFFSQERHCTECDKVQLRRVYV